ncbi:MAG: tRNA adenosine(34) deaminase TadA [Firmicutes bacterium]|nr:tRNA adenosine(34) deaminase TadA [Bacillota bacterium]
METLMRIALVEAKKAAAADEVPVGAVVVRDGEIVARAHNCKIKNNSAFAHAELIAMTKAAKKLGDWRLNECTLFVTLEPCPMCAGAIINARVKEVVFGAYDPKAGCCGTLYNLPEDKRFNHRAKVTGGVLEEECGRILTEYFKTKRKNSPL